MQDAEVLCDYDTILKQMLTFEFIVAYIIYEILLCIPSIDFVSKI